MHFFSICLCICVFLANKIDEGTRVRQGEWTALAQNLAAAERKKSGSLRDRDIDGSVVDDRDVIDTEYLETGEWFVVVLFSIQYDSALMFM